MSVHPVLTGRSLAAVAVCAGLLAAFAGPATASGEAVATSGSPVPVPDASPSAAPMSPGPSSVPMTPDILFHPLPPVVAVIPDEVPTVSLGPTSVEALEIGQPIAFTLGHCGLLSPIDLDGSLWRPVGGAMPDGSPIASDEAIGELINATDGTFEIVAEDAAHFETATGTLLRLERAEGALDYPLCT